MSREFDLALSECQNAMRSIGAGHSRDAGRQACGLLNLGPGCLDSQCCLYGLGTIPELCKTRYSCKCLSHLSSTDRQAILCAIRAAARVLDPDVQ